MRDQYFRWAPGIPVEAWLHYRRSGGVVQLVGAQPFGDESLIHFLTPGEDQRYSRALIDADAEVVAGMPQGWRERIKIALKEPGRFPQLPPSLAQMDAEAREFLAQQQAELERRRFLKVRAQHRSEWEDLYGPVDPFLVLAVAERFCDRPDADEDWWRRLHNQPPEAVS